MRQNFTRKNNVPKRIIKTKLGYQIDKMLKNVYIIYIPKNI